MTILQTLEKPVFNAVIALLTAGEKTASSGFHHNLNKCWGIVLEGYASDRVTQSAKLAGLEVAYRTFIRTRVLLTEIFLYGVGEDEKDKAQEIFDRFADIYKAS